MSCIFCDLSEKKESILFQNASFFAVPDKYPASNGHSLIIAKAHLESFFEMNKDEVQDLFEALQAVRDMLDEKHHPDAYNIGVNEGVAAGRTIPHFHVHLIPRYSSAPVKGGIEALLKEKNG